MNRLLQLKQDAASKLDSAGAILQKAQSENRAMTTEECAQSDALISEADQIEASITFEEKMATRMNAYTDKTKNPDALGVQERGVGGNHVEVRDNIVGKPWGYEARANETPQERRRRVEYGFGEYLIDVKNATLKQRTGDKGDPRLYALNADYEKRAAAAGSSESVPSDGGFLVYPDFADEVLTLAHDTGIVYTRARNLPLSEFTNAIKIPAIDEQSRADGSRWGGVQVYWEGEADAFKGSKPTVAQIEMILKKLTGLYYATSEVLADARLLGTMVMTAFSQEIGYKLDDGCIRGTGAGQPQGILNSKALVSITKETGQAAATVTLINLQAAWARMWAPSRYNAVWFINQDVEPALMSLSQVVGTGGIPVFLPAGTGGGLFGGASAAPMVQSGMFGSAQTSGTLFGRPVYSIEQCSTLGTQGDVILADFGQYLMINKAGLQTAQSMHVRFLTDELTYRWIYRTDGQSWWRKDLTPAHGSKTLSPFVVLDTRA